ncbi:anti-sigma factor family protein [Pedobacter sp.]|uniref:anti-sigma factor family protein n=1 Tax=Pedobacter sp. TaxID=1411316 RepID=UPI003BAC97F2
MNLIEQQLWDYIDGNLTEAEQKDIELKIADNSDIKQQYEDLLSINNTLNELEIDAPSMSFTRNVMESVALEPAPVALRTKVDTRIVYGVSLFFLLPLLAIFGYVVSTTSFTMPNFSKYFSTNFNIQDYLTPTTVYVFIGVDVILALIFMDYLLRKNLNQKV